MNVAEKVSKESFMPAPETSATSSDRKLTSIFLSILPWAIVGGLLWAGIFVKPEITIETVTPPSIEKRDRIYGVSVITPEVLWVAGNYGKILRSEDGGKTWEHQDTSTRSHLQDISAWDTNHAVAVGNGGIVLITEDGGSNWTEVEAPKSEIANKLFRVHTYPNGEAWSVGELGMIIHTIDYGRTWKRMREEEDVIMNDIIKLDNGKLLIVGEYGRIFWSEDNGTTWQDAETESPSSLMAIDFRNAASGVAVGLDGIIMRTEDTGKSWTMFDSSQTGNSEHLMDVQWVSEINKWVAVGNKGKYIKFSSEFKEFDPGSLSERSLSSHTELAAVQGGLFAVGADVGFLDLSSNNFTNLGH